MTAGNDQLQQRLDRLGQLLGLPLLAVATLLAWVATDAGFGTWSRFEHGLGVVATAAVWTLVFSMRKPGGNPWAGTAIFVVHSALAAVLVGVNPWFGLFAFTGYGVADHVPLAWRRLGFVTTACIVAASQSAGWPFGDGGEHWAGYLVIAAVNITLVLAFERAMQRVFVQNAERGRIIAELNDANERLETVIAENAGLHAQLVEQAREAGVQDERQRLAGEIHDTLAQGLAGIVTQLEAADHAAALPDQWRRHVDQARDLARSSLTEARRSVRALRPEQLEAATLVQAIDELAQVWTRTTAVPVSSEATGTARPLPEAVESALFRVAQEGLTNVTKHAKASSVWLTLTYLDDVVMLDLRDDGVGLAAEGRKGGYGLDAMRQRLARVGGRLEIESGPGEGTVISASIPCVPA
jgi:signal transduction histidine kinase